MAQIREIRKRIKAVGNIQRITKTMQMIATAKFQAAIRRAQATQPYTRKLAEIVGELASATSGDQGADHPLLHAPSRPTGKRLLLVLSSNRGLCGAYNAGVLRTAAKYMKTTEGENTLQVAGKKGIAFFRFAGNPIEQAYTDFGDKPAYEQVEALATSYIDRFLAGEFDSVEVLYTRFISNAKQSPEIMRLLPLDRPADESSSKKATGPAAVYEFSPDPQTLLTHLLPLTVKSRLFQAFNDAVVSEQISRMVAMKSATDNAGKMSRGLKRKFNRARQTQITTELSEIIGGAAALE